ncbi:Fic family protein [Candidatus Woesearchaeota archaeon]|nr:Fic family protein [Candidatus Woesearchaeota archaeon]
MRIVTRKIGNKDYYYLQHSFRKNGKVVTREIYLGPSLPEDIEDRKRAFFRALQGDLFRKFEQIKMHFQKEWKRVPESLKVRELGEISIAFTFNTNAIEGSTITLPETRGIIRDHVAPQKPLRDIRETEAHHRVFLGMLKNKERIGIELLHTWHKNLFTDTKPEIAGRYRDFLVRVGSYIAPDWQDVGNLMQEFFAFIRKSKLHPVELAARAHYRFEGIHPYGDGNGRIGRLLMNHILWHAGYPILIIEHKARGSYYHALQKGEDRFVSYFFRRYIKVNWKRAV